MGKRILAAAALAAAIAAPSAGEAAAPFNVRGQAGALGYPSGNDQIDSGSTYGVSLGFESGYSTGLELGYSGASYGTSGFAGEGPITENGGQALLKSGPTFGSVRPYLAAGYELSWMNAAERAAIVGIADDEMLQKFPVGAGLDIHFGGDEAGLILGARGLYRFVYDSDVVGTGDGTFGDDQLSGTLVLGGGF